MKMFYMMKIMMMKIKSRVGVVVGCVVALSAVSADRAAALDRLCDPANEDCRRILLSYINAEKVGIDVGFWFMEDARYTAALKSRKDAGVRVRVLMDLRANESTPANVTRLAELQSAGIPMRRRTATGIMHYKFMMFAGQGIVQFSGANFSADAWVYEGLTPYVNYIDEAAYFTDNPSFVQSFMKKYDDLWTSTSGYTDYANIVGPLTRNYGNGADIIKDPQLNFPPAESYANRAVGRYRNETEQIDVIMYRITDRRHADEMIQAQLRGVPVRLITEPKQYRDPKRLWHSWNVDRMHVAGIPIKVRAHAGLNHQKLVLLYSQRMSIFGSSNWTGPSDASQEEHNCFCTGTAMFDWFQGQFDRKWNNTAGVVENSAFVPLPPGKPVNNAPANLATDLATASVTLKWDAGLWAHKYDVLLGTDPLNLQPVLVDTELGPSLTTTQYKSFAVTNLLPGTTYYWRVVSRTMANLTKTGDLWSFTTAGDATPPPPSGTIATGDVVLHGLSARITGAQWSLVSDSTAAGGRRVASINAGAAKVTTASSSPGSYVEFTFNAVAGQPYHLWIRGRAEGNLAANDSAFVQFSDSVTSAGAATYRINSTSAAEFNLENCSGCGLSGWGWQDNGWGFNVDGPRIYFATTGPQTLRIQTREDGLSIDQIILSPSTASFLSASPGALKNDTRIYPAASGVLTRVEPALMPGVAQPAAGLHAGVWFSDSAPASVAEAFSTGASPGHASHSPEPRTAAVLAVARSAKEPDDVRHAS